MAGNLEDKITADLKEAMLAKNAQRVSVLRSIKSSFIYAKTAPGASDGSLADDQILQLLAKEAKKRQESADSFLQAGQPDRADDELTEKNIIEEYLPAKLGEAELSGIVEEVVATIEAPSMQSMGQVIGAVKAQAGPTADGALIAQLVKERLSRT